MPTSERACRPPNRFDTPPTLRIVSLMMRGSCSFRGRHDGVTGGGICSPGVRCACGLTGSVSGVMSRPCSGDGHSPRGRASMMPIIATAISNWRRIDASRRPSVIC
jgi:hypothetical protein